MSNKDTLPPLPEPDHSLDCGDQPFYRPDQMHAYARAAIAAQAPTTYAPSDKTVWRLIDATLMAEGLPESLALHGVMKRLADSVIEQVSVQQSAPAAQEPMPYLVVHKALHDVDDFIARVNGDDCGSFAPVETLRKALGIRVAEPPMQYPIPDYLIVAESSRPCYQSEAVFDWFEAGVRFAEKHHGITGSAK